MSGYSPLGRRLGATFCGFQELLKEDVRSPTRPGGCGEILRFLRKGVRFRADFSFFSPILLVGDCIFPENIIK
jgi:hypothetical protein